MKKISFVVIIILGVLCFSNAFAKTKITSIEFNEELVEPVYNYGDLEIPTGLLTVKEINGGAVDNSIVEVVLSKWMRFERCEDYVEPTETYFNNDSEYRYIINLSLTDKDNYYMDYNTQFIINGGIVLDDNYWVTTDSSYFDYSNGNMSNVDVQFVSFNHFTVQDGYIRIALNANGGELNWYQDYCIVQYGSSLLNEGSPYNFPTASKTGYVFDGWEDFNSYGTYFSPTETIYSPKYLKARWAIEIDIPYIAYENQSLTYNGDYQTVNVEDYTYDPDIITQEGDSFMQMEPRYPTSGWGGYGPYPYGECYSTSFSLNNNGEEKYVWKLPSEYTPSSFSDEYEKRHETKYVQWVIYRATIIPPYIPSGYTHYEYSGEWVSPVITYANSGDENLVTLTGDCAALDYENNTNRYITVSIKEPNRYEWDPGHMYYYYGESSDYKYLNDSTESYSLIWYFHPKMLNDFQVNGLYQPVIGAKPDMTCYAPSGEHYSISAPIWYSGGNVMSPNDRFEEYGSYSVVISFTLESDNYSFGTSYDQANLFSLNGIDEMAYYKGMENYTSSSCYSVRFNFNSVLQPTYGMEIVGRSGDYGMDYIPDTDLWILGNVTDNTKYNGFGILVKNTGTAPLEITEDNITITISGNDTNALIVDESIYTGEVIIIEPGVTGNTGLWVGKTDDFVVPVGTYNAQITVSMDSLNLSDSINIQMEIIHSLMSKAAVAPTCTTPGSPACYECRGCHKLFMDEEGLNELDESDLIPALGHSMQAYPEVPATTTTTGTEAYWKCTRCNKLFSDEEGLNEINAPVVIPLIDKIQLEKPWLDSDEEYYYTGEAIYPVIYGFDESKMYKSGIYTSLTPGTHEFVIGLKEPDKYIWSDGSSEEILYTWRINKAVLLNLDINQTDYYYTGEDIIPDMDFHDQDTTLYVPSGEWMETDLGSYELIVIPEFPEYYEFENGASELHFNWNIVPAKLDTIVIYDLDYPVIGNYQDTNITVSDEQHFSLVDSGTVWYNETDGGAEMIASDKFEANKSYSLQLVFEPKYGYVFDAANNMYMSIDYMYSSLDDYPTFNFRSVQLEDPNDDTVYMVVTMRFDLGDDPRVYVERPTLSGDGQYTFTGQAIEPQLVGYDSTIMHKSGDYSATLPGTYTFTVELNNSNDYLWSGDEFSTASYTWTISPAEILVPEHAPGSDPVYTGEVIYPGIINYNAETDSDKIEAIFPNSIEPGEYVITFKLKPGYIWKKIPGRTYPANYETSDKYIDYTIQKISVSYPGIVTLIDDDGFADYTYTGEEIHPDFDNYNEPSDKYYYSGDLYATVPGEYEARAIIYDPAHYEFEGDSESPSVYIINWRIEKAKLENPSFAVEHGEECAPYTGSEIEVFPIDYVGQDEDLFYLSRDTSGTDIGDYYVRINIADPDCYSFENGESYIELEWWIVEANIDTIIIEDFREPIIWSINDSDITPSNDSYSVYSVVWHNDTEDYVMDETFIYPNHTYTIAVTLHSNYGYKFDYVNNITATLDGISGDLYDVQIESLSYDDTEIKVSFTFEIGEEAAAVTINDIDFGTMKEGYDNELAQQFVSTTNIGNSYIDIHHSFLSIDLKNEFEYVTGSDTAENAWLPTGETNNVRFLLRPVLDLPAGNYDTQYSFNDGLSELGTANVYLTIIHDLVKVDEVPATYTESGKAAYWECVWCGKKFADESGDNEVTDEELVIPKLQSKIEELNITTTNTLVNGLVSDAVVEIDTELLNIDNYTFSYNVSGQKVELATTDRFEAGVDYYLEIQLERISENVILNLTKDDISINGVEPLEYESGDTLTIYGLAIPKIEADVYSIETRDAVARTTTTPATIITSATPGTMIRVSAPNPVSGQSFIGWISNIDLTGAERTDSYNNHSIIVEMPNEKLVLYPEWSYDIKKIAIAETIAEPSASGYGMGDPIPALNLTISSVNDDATLVNKVIITDAKWVRVAENHELEDVTGNFDYANEYALVINFSLTDESHYHFYVNGAQVVIDGWEDNYDNYFYNNNYPYTGCDLTNVDGQYVSYDHCTVEDDKCLVLLYANGGTFGNNDNDNERSIVITKGQTLSDVPCPQPYNGNYIFDGWTTSPNEMASIFDKNYSINYTTHLYAYWAEEINPPTIENPDLVYNGLEQSPVVSGYDEEKMNIVGYSTVSAVNACDYSYPYYITYTPKDGYVWPIPENPDGLNEYEIRHGNRYVYWRINKKNINKPYVSVTEYTYTGNEIIPTIVYDSGDENAFTISGTTSATSVGDYSMTFTLSNANYLWNYNSDSFTVDWSIEKVSLVKPYISGKTRFVYNKNEIEPTLVGYDENLYILSGVNKATNPGSYSFTIAIKDKNSCKWENGLNDDLTFDWKIFAKGDVNRNGEVDVTDIRLLLQEVINSDSNTVWEEEDMEIMDMNDDTKIDVTDIRMLLQLIINQ